MSTTSVTAALSEFCRSIRYHDLPADTVEVARQTLLDWLGVTIAGSSEPLAEMLRDEVLDEGGNAQATLVGSGHQVTAKQAALVNGAASHALDYDDVNLAMSGHPSVPIWPALLALAEWRGGSGRDVLTAFVAGYEMECRVGMLVMPSHYSTGFHSTGTLGTFGAAAACAHLLGFDQDQWERTMGIAGAQAAGLKSMFGTMCKPLHAGKAAANGLFAALMAERGFTSNREVLETAQGFAATQSSAANVERALAGFGEHYAVRDTLFKYHAACYGTHETIEGVLRLKHANSLASEDLAGIDLVVPQGHLAMCNIQQPTTGLEGKFSLRFTAALAFVDEETNDAAFTDARVHEPRLTAIRDRVTITPQEGDWERGTGVTLRTRDGRAFSEHVNLNIPAADVALQRERLETKFRGLASGVIGTAATDRMLREVEEFDHQPSVEHILEATVSAAVGVA